MFSMIPMWARAAGVAALLLALWFANQYFIVSPAVAKNEKTWSDKWAGRDRADAKAKQDYDNEQRAKEQSAQLVVDRIQRDSQAEIAAANRRAAGARAESGRLQQGVSAAISQLQQQRGEDTSTPGSRSAGASAGVLLSQLFGEIDIAAGNYAAEADRARAAGLTCERAYNEVRKVINDKATE